ncbi:MAG: LytTR family transcriptional regulator [Bacteroidales bacterium]|nr:LytTR family transcriptional regulator [Bacteroidales bacterium]MCF8343845.1 LytTR family transcriptional regulator [Bacteroidales bacterium]MCF8349569.1 LytTR family transcriptional regulator [Bacteroidales bacterium]MCF8375128.1 LytTR family transcriptional regulator [Bacteroidales bacterium]MCF8400035.1 LytTR family transcriptional regulator [Bacteroidales bacterium]
MDQKTYELIKLLKDEWKLFLSIALGVFLFILFFQPFETGHMEFNNRLLFTAGMAGIVFLVMLLVRTFTPWLFRFYVREEYTEILISNIGGFIILLLSAAGMAFYLNYVGWITLSLYLMFKVVLVCLIPPVALKMNDLIKDLKMENRMLLNEKLRQNKMIGKYEDDIQNKSLNFVSEGESENLELRLSDIVYIKSADNYVEIAYLKEGDLKKELLRNTLKNIEKQLKPYAKFIRCHRSCMVNANYIEKLLSKNNTYVIKVKGQDEQLPVSRQYLLNVRKIVS